MKTVKYKAWDKLFKKMRTNFAILPEGAYTGYKHPVLLNLGAPTDNAGTYCIIEARIPDDIILLQFTTQIDIENKDIYQGDIVLTDHPDYAGQIYGVIEWQEYCFVINYKSPHDKYAPTMLSEWVCKYQKIKVVGNIYENSDILARIFEKKSDKKALTQNQQKLLAALSDGRNYTAKELYTKAGVSGHGYKGALNALLKAGLVEDGWLNDQWVYKIKEV